MRVCLAYDCLYPWTVGGAERWMRSLAESLVAEGHEVTYLTRRQWEAGNEPRIPGVRVVAVSRADALYGPGGNRRIGPPLRFGRGVLGHLLRHGDDYDVVHMGAFPYFSLLAAGLAGTQPLFVDWFEVWSGNYWRRYLGWAGGLAGWAVQRACARVPQQAFTFSELHADRLRHLGQRGTPIRLGGLYNGGPAAMRTAPDVVAARPPLVVFAGRHIAEKRVPAIPAAIARARRRIPDLHALILGDGPEHSAVWAAMEAEGVTDCVRLPGFVGTEEVRAAIASASCLLLPSQREGYGMVVIEAAAQGTPSVVAQGPDNAAVELIEEGTNGVIAASDSSEDLADAVVRAIEGGEPLRQRTAAWFDEHVEQLSVARSTRQVLAAYAAATD